MAEGGRKSFSMHMKSNADDVGRPIQFLQSLKPNDTIEERIYINSVLLTFSSEIEGCLRKECPTLTVKLKGNGDCCECILNGTANEVEHAKSELDAMEKKVVFSTNINAALKMISLQELICNLLKDKYSGCDVQQKHNEIFLFGVDRSMIDDAALFVSRNIIHKEVLLCGSLRERKEDVVGHFNDKYKNRIVIYVDGGYRLNLLGQKEAVDEALSEYIEISEGRKSLSPTKTMISKRKPTVTKRTLPCVYFSYIKKLNQLDEVVNHEKVRISFNESDYSILIQGEEENVVRAVGYLDKTTTRLHTDKIEIPCSEPMIFFRLYQDINDVDECLKMFNVLIEKKAVFAGGNICVTNVFQSDTRSIWSTSNGAHIAVEFLAFDKMRVEQKFVMKKRDPMKGGNFKALANGLVEIYVPEMVNRQENDGNTIDNVINNTLANVLSSSVKTVAFLISSFANWDFNSIMNCMVNSFVEWLLMERIAGHFSVALCVENNTDFVKTNEYFGSSLWTKMKDLEIESSKIKIVEGYLDKARADVIVNTVAPDLNLSTGNVSRALLQAAGQELLTECKKYHSGGIKPGDIAVTGGYSLKCKAVFHVTLHRRDKSNKCNIENIRNAMSLCLKTASEYNYKSIAFPAMGTGSLQYPIDEVASEMVMALERFRKEYKKAVPIKEVLIVIFPNDTDLLRTFKEMVKEIVKPASKTEVKVIVEITGNKKNVADCKSWYENKAHGPEITNSTCRQRSDITHCTIHPRSDSPIKNTGRDRPMRADDKADIQPANVPTCFIASNFQDKKTLKCKIKGEASVQVKVHCDDIINLQNIDAVVCSENRIGNAKGIVARLLLEYGGEAYRQEKTLNFTKKPKISDIVTTRGGSSNYKWIVHAIMPRKDPAAIPGMYKKLFEEFVEKKFESVSMPLLGTGVGDVDPKSCTEMLLEELVKFCQTQTRSKFILHLVINDEKVVDIVKNVFITYTDKINTTQKKNENEYEPVIDKVKDGSSHDQVEDDEYCVICMDKVTDEKKLPCGHRFCAECIEGYFKVRMVCPTCGKVCGKVTGDQPDGCMAVGKQAASVTGFEKHKSIVITYTFDSGIQGVEHPNPGAAYKGIRRVAYLPDNERGRQTCAMLIVAFERRLIFTIGTSRTTGKESVITWNDIHHKTDMRPNTQFGYPDDTYLQRVGEELGVKGVTLKDVDQKLLKELKEDNFRKLIHFNTGN